MTYTSTYLKLACPMTEFYTVTELAEAYAITPRAIRFYETKGLLTPQRVGWTRAYSHRDRVRLELILRGKRLGFSLADIKEYLSLYDVDTDQAEQLLLLVKKVRTRVHELERQRSDLGRTLKELREIETQAVAALKERGVADDRDSADVPTRPKRARASARSN
ncbi:MAG: MerR family DNA-binding transcriptional regulator [Acidiferrobacterales bacterium]